jgi:hypothetical protein
VSEDDYSDRDGLASLIGDYLATAYDDQERRGDELIALDLADLLIERGWRIVNEDGR